MSWERKREESEEVRWRRRKRVKVKFVEIGKKRDKKKWNEKRENMNDEEKKKMFRLERMFIDSRGKRKILEAKECPETNSDGTGLK